MVWQRSGPVSQLFSCVVTLAFDDYKGECRHSTYPEVLDTCSRWKSATCQRFDTKAAGKASIQVVGLHAGFHFISAPKWQVLRSSGWLGCKLAYPSLPGSHHLYWPIICSLGIPWPAATPAGHMFMCSFRAENAPATDDWPLQVMASWQVCTRGFGSQSKHAQAHHFKSQVANGSSHFLVLTCSVHRLA